MDISPSFFPTFQTACSFHHQGQYQAAIDVYFDCLNFAPNNVDILSNLGSALVSNRQHKTAEAYFKKGLYLNQGHPKILTNYGNLLRKQGRFAEAEILYKRLLTHHGDKKEYLLLAGMLYRDWHKPLVALDYFRKVQEIDSEHENVIWELSRMYLEAGYYDKGFELFDARFQLDGFGSRDIPGKPWNGEPLVGKSLLVTAEQGYGDILQFSRFIALLVRKSHGRIFCELPKPIFTLFCKTPGIKWLIKGEELPNCDYHIPIMSLANRLGCSENNIPAPWWPPGLKKYKNPVNSNQLKIGLIWSGKPTPTDRSIDLEDLIPLLSHPRFECFSLQIDKKKEAINNAMATQLITDLSDEINNFSDTARLMQQLDLIISVDTGPVHLAGLLGIPTCLLVHYTSDWRWRLEKHTTPWYPSMKLFCQEEWGCWDKPLVGLARYLDNLAKNTREVITQIKKPTS
ncbi:glycosyltransferase family protein [Endozoicomonas sp. SM1973]|uniref:Glycosyltransferase family protein n=1 Tax=Spartinivicinus marinus TaxID=2994442 RepID=A0A853IAP5_9GAMM|nr:tetratricopeptide repeat protein [Spartinivicinus marinus]MCX4026662.1 tetratricopeptide repeat-containing glycosyltransferase family protein [Spartinivicinus marinus]NYZ64496.1 glycosyltransferase family protein [Spartinivicinus marinus]